MGDRSESLLDIGKIVGTHGLRGDLKVRLHSGEPEVLLKLRKQLAKEILKRQR